MTPPNSHLARCLRLFCAAVLLASTCIGVLIPLTESAVVASRNTWHQVPWLATLAARLPQPAVALAADIGFPHTQTFDALTPNTNNVPTAWVQVTGDGYDTSCFGISAACNDWIVDNGGTPSNNTGPAADHTGGGNFLYVEASSNSNNTVELLSPSFNLPAANSPQVSFWVHRYDGNNNGDSHELRIDLLNATATNVIQFSLLVIDNSVLDQNSWVQQVIDLTAFKGNGEVRLRFRWVNSPGNSSYSPDIAIDDFQIEDTNPTAPGELLGNVFRDYNANGVRDMYEPGIGGVQVYVIDEFGVAATTTTLANGSYAIAPSAGLSGNARLEFTLPNDASLDYLKAGAAGNTTTQFVNLSTGLFDQSVGFADPVDYCQANPSVATSMLYSTAASGAAAAQSALLRIPYNASGHDFTPASAPVRSGSFQGVDMATWSQIGATYGMAWQRSHARLYVAAFHKRYSGFGPRGPDAIYQTNLAGTITGVIELDALLGTTNSTGSDAHNFTTSGGIVYDIGTSNASYDGVGKRAFGDLELSSDMRTLYAVNLFNRRIYALDVSSGNTANTQIVTSWAAPDATGANRHRPFALSWHNGLLWVGSVDQNGSAAYVHSLNPATGATTLRLTIPLTYTRQNWFGTMSASLPANWRAWSADPTTVSFASSGSGTEISYPQAMLTDIEFTGEDMILGFRDRWGDQTGPSRPFRPGTSTQTWGDAAGEILYACATGTTYTVETGTGGACGNPTASQGMANSGPGGHERYFWDIWNDTSTWNPDSTSGAFHWETAQGALVQLAGQPAVMTSAMDPFSDFSGGVLKLTNATGQRVGVTTQSATSGALTGGYTIFDSLDFAVGGYATPTNHTLAKANGLGDIEALCDPAPIELGNRVWLDSNGDGVQDPAETPIAGVTVTLHDMNNGGAQVGTATTDANGNYYFGGATNGNLAGGQSILTNRQYELRVATTQSALAGLYLSSVQGAVGNAASNNLHDSDAVQVGTVALIGLTTGLAGANDHSWDFGFTPTPQADLVVVKYDDLDPMIAGTVLTYTIVVTNNGPNAATDVTITDILPEGTSFFSATPGCLPSGNTVVCALGTLPLNSVTTIRIGVLVDPSMTRHFGRLQPWAFLWPRGSPPVLLTVEPRVGSLTAAQIGAIPYGPT